MRRSLLVFAAAGLLVAASQSQDSSQDAGPILAAGEMRFAWTPDWLQLPEGMALGNTHGATVVDAKGRVFFNTDAKHAVCVASPSGELVDSWGEELAGGLHGMTIVDEVVPATEEGKPDTRRQVLYLTHTGRHEWLKTTLEGEILMRVGWPEASGKYESAGQYKPTGIAVAPGGDVFVADGYGQNWVHRYSAAGEWLGCFGGRGSEPGQFVTCHGIMLDARGEQPSLLVSDRENHRLQRFDLEGKHLAVIEADLRRPCNTYAHGEHLVVADLAGRISILDGDNQLVGHLGDNPDPAKRAQNGVPTDQWAHGEFLSPHSAAWDGMGNLYVMDWNRAGRMTKLQAVHGQR